MSCSTTKAFQHHRRDLKAAQGYELQLGTNSVGSFLLTKLLHPILAQTTETAPASSVRVVWVSSNSAEIPSPQNGIDMSNLDYHVDKSAATKSSISKAGNIFHSSEFARRYCHEGMIIVSLMPGALNSDLRIYGAYTEAFSGLGPDMNEGMNGAYDVSWGRFYDGVREM